VSVARVDLVRAGAQRTALAATGIVAVIYVLIAVAVVVIVGYNETSNIDNRLSSTLSQMNAQRTAGSPTFGGPRGGPGVAFDTLWWMYHPDGNVYDSSPTAQANGLQLPVSPTSIKAPQDITIDEQSFRVEGGPVGDDWAVVALSLDPVNNARSNILEAEVIIGPVLLLIVFLGALAIGRRVAQPIEAARRRQMDFTANASHELRTPLSVIQAQSSLALAQPRSTAWYQHAFEQVNRESQRMRRLVDDLLWLARFEATTRSTKTEPVDVGVMAQAAVDRFGAVAESRKQRLGITLRGESAVIAAAPEWLDHLIGVLIDNASKYTPQGGSIDVSVKGEGHAVRLAVDDSGPGIPETERERIFDRFQRATDQAGGAGLGLAIADAVVRATNGRWEVGKSAAGGASLAVTWPRVLAKGAGRRSTSGDIPPLASLDV
jgi:signal transduction histidine kinase